MKIITATENNILQETVGEGLAPPVSFANFFVCDAASAKAPSGRELDFAKQKTEGERGNKGKSVGMWREKKAMCRRLLPSRRCVPPSSRRKACGKRCLSCSPMDCEILIVFCGRFLNRPYQGLYYLCRGHSRMTRGDPCGKRGFSCSPMDCGNSIVYCGSAKALPYRLLKNIVFR